MRQSSVRAERKVIAANVRACRESRFPGPDGMDECAAQFGVDAKTWSAYEKGLRDLDTLHFVRMAEFFGTTLEWFRRDNNGRPPPGVQYPELIGPDLLHAMHRDRVKLVYTVEIRVSGVRYLHDE